MSLVFHLLGPKTIATLKLAINFAAKIKNSINVFVFVFFFVLQCVGVLFSLFDIPSSVRSSRRSSSGRNSGGYVCAFRT